MQLSDITIQEAVLEWLMDEEGRNRARLKWGPIEDWDTSQVTNMAHLFYDYRCIKSPNGTVG